MAITKKTVGGLAPFGYATDSEIPQLKVRRGRNKTYAWYIRTQNPFTKRRVNRKLGPYPAIPLQKARQLAREIIYQIYDDGTEVGLPSNCPTLENWWKHYDDGELKRLKNPQPYINGWNKLSGYIDTSKALTAYSIGDMKSLHRQMSEDTPSMADFAISVLSILYNLAEAEEKIPSGSNPCKHVKKNNLPSRTRTASKEELAKILSAISVEAEHPEQALIAEILIYTGARTQEILQLKNSWTSSDGHVTIPAESHKTGRKSGDKQIFIPPHLLRQLQAYGQGRDVFFSTTYAQLRRWWQAFTGNLGIDGLTLHDLRRTWATIGLEGGESLDHLAGQMGHKSIGTTKRYAQLNRTSADNAARNVARAIDNLRE